uniref:Ceruloplasmin n=1 Tax=Lepisosteus oculatus TaxID=7918 RepID=W5M0L7_LEPOC
PSLSRMTYLGNVLSLLLCLTGAVCGVQREYFIGIKEVQWDYAPSKMNLILNQSLNEDEHVATFLRRGEDRIGSVYKKAVYLQYTSATYREEVEKPQWLGFLGPLIAAEEGDTVVIHLKNFASRAYTLHSHGMKYTKDNEGAFYPDHTSSGDKRDDHIQPGANYTYVWEMTAPHAPAKDDTNCLTRIYHSHIDAPRDVSSGLIGPLIICRKGTLDVFGDSAATYLYALLFTVSDENLSWYLDDNIQTYCSAPDKVDKEDEDFQESNKMHSINGYVYGNLPGLTMCVGDKIHWHLFGMGNEVDVHSAFFHGQILTERKHHVDTVSLFPATFVNAEMVPANPGKWLLSCQVNDHMEGGMQAFFEVKNCFPKVHPGKPRGTVRQYYIAAEEVIWDYGPSQINQFTGNPLKSDRDSEPFFETGSDRIGGKYKKAVYVEYTDHSFTKRKERTPEEEHLGILGPVIRSEVGDTIRVTFWNNANRPYSIQPHGVLYTKDNEGTLYNSIPGGHVTPSFAAHVLPGSNVTYEWTVPLDSGPAADDPDCINWLYFSGVDTVKDPSSGLVGPLLVCKRNTLKSGKQKNIDKEFHLLATVFDENLSWYLDENIKMFAGAPDTVQKEDADFDESNKMHSINGYMYGNLKGLKMCLGDKVSWHLYGLGSEVDMHGIFFNGNTFITKGTRRDVVNLFPHISQTLIMQPDAIGEFGVVCRTTDHYRGGMKEKYTVEKCSWWNSGKDLTFFYDKTYYIAAVETEWDYSPNRTWEEERHMFHDESPGNTFINKEDKFIGSKYKKVLYREFTDSTFTTPKTRGEDETHLAILGPIIHAEVGNKIKIVFKNMAGRNFSIHAHGVKTESPRIKETAPGEIQEYTWIIPKKGGPAPGEAECSVAAYFSTADLIKDMYSGLIGPIVVCRKDFLRKVGLKKQIEEFVLLFLVFDENESWYLDENIKTYVKEPAKARKDDEEFIESNKMHAMNGRIYGNVEGLTMHAGDHVYWHLMGMGNEVDMHTVHFHGHSFDYKLSGTHRTDVFDLFPATFQTVEMRPEYLGTWLIHCHVTDHIHAGMEATYTVLEKALQWFHRLYSCISAKITFRMGD